MLQWLIALVAGLGAALVTYPILRRGGGGLVARVASVCRALATMLVVALALNAGVGRRRPVKPLVALDVSASWTRGRDSTAFHEARAAALAATTDSVLAFGDSVRRATRQSNAGDQASAVRLIAERASAAGRPLVLYTDGEIDDPETLSDLPAGSQVVLPAGSGARDAAVADVRAPAIVATGDTVTVRVSVVAGTGGAGRGRVALQLDGREVTAQSFDSLEVLGERSLDLRFVAPAGTSAGSRELRVVVQSDGDGDTRNDVAGAALEISAGAAAVFVSTAPDLDARELAALLRGSVAVPTRGYFQVAPGQWREDGRLHAVSEAVVRRAVREAALVVLHGDTARFGPPRTVTRGSLALLAPPAGDVGEWFATGAPLSPVSTLLTGMAWDSLPPLEVSAASPMDAEFELLEARRSRRLDRRVAIVGWERPRRVLVSVGSGFWRWRFRGGAGADAFTAVWGSALDWLAGQRSDVRAVVPASPAARAGVPIEWVRGSNADSLARVTLTRRGDGTSETLDIRFAATNSRATTRALSPGTYEVRGPGGTSLLVVNPAGELIPRRPSVKAGPFGTRPVSGEQPRARDLPWLFALAVAALCVEWILRRRAGLR